jgi:hypothetical protein
VAYRGPPILTIADSSVVVPLLDSARTLLRVTYRPMAMASLRRVPDFAAYVAKYESRGDWSGVHTAASVILTPDLERNLEVVLDHSMSAFLWAKDSAETELWSAFLTHKTGYIADKLDRGLVTRAYLLERQRRLRTEQYEKDRRWCERSASNYACLGMRR